MKFSHHRIRNACCGLGCTILLLNGCSREPASERAAVPPPQVTIAHPLPVSVIDYDEYAARIVATDFVEIRPRVSGYLNEILFAEGAEVKKGDLLFRIDPRPYEAAVRRLEAVLAETRVNAQLAEFEAANAVNLRKGQAISLEESERRTKSAEGQLASVQAAEASLAIAQLELEWTEVRAPIDGRTSDARVTVGNLVSAESLLTTLLSQDPVYVFFDVDERSALRYRSLYPNAESALLVGAEVRMRLLNDTNWAYAGVVDFVDNQLQISTGTLRARTRFANPDRTLTPGLFARVRLPGSEEYEAVLVPDNALASDQGTPYVWTLNEADEAVFTPVRTGPLRNGMRVVREGITVSDRVIINGIMNVRNLRPVQPTLETLQADESEAPFNP